MRYAHELTGQWSDAMRLPVLQVGIVAVNLLGENLGNLAPGALDARPSPYGAGPRVPPSCARGSVGGGGIAGGRSCRAELNDLSFDLNFDPETAQRIRDVAAAKDKAVSAEVGRAVLRREIHMRTAQLKDRVPKR